VYKNTQNIITLYWYYYILINLIKFVLHNLCQTIMHSTELEKLIISPCQPAFLHSKPLRPNIEILLLLLRHSFNTTVKLQYILT